MMDFTAASYTSPTTGTAKFEIVITPKMSFGTGHHATTYMMIKLMKDINFENTSVLDFGTGTGILAILAEKSGAKEIYAIDNDEWSIANAEENFKKNNCRKIILHKASGASSDIQFDIILANINKHVILENLETLAQLHTPNGVILLSGLLQVDSVEIVGAAEKAGFKLSKKIEKNNWIGLQLNT